MILSLIILTFLFWVIYEASLKFTKKVNEIIKDYKKLEELKKELKDFADEKQNDKNI